MEMQTNFPRAPELIIPIYTGNSPLSRVHHIAFSRLAASRRSRPRELAALEDTGGIPIEMRIRTYVRAQWLKLSFPPPSTFARSRFTDLHLKLKSQVSLGFILGPILIIDASLFLFLPLPLSHSCPF